MAIPVTMMLLFFLSLNVNGSAAALQGLNKPENSANGLSSQKSSECGATVAPQWPSGLGVLSQKERAFRGKYFISSTEFELSSHEGIAQDLCQTWLNGLKAGFSNGDIPSDNNGISFEVLGPSIIYDPKLFNEAGAPRPAANSCANLSSLKMYGTPDSGVMNSDIAFDMQAVSEEVNRASSVLQGSANYEYYDLSKYLGDGVWFYQSEGVLRSECKPAFEKLCLDSGYARFKGSMGMLFNTNTCRTAYFPHLQQISQITAVMTLNRSEAGKCNAYPNYSQSPNFSAVIKMGNKLFLLSFYSPYGWDTFDLISNPKSKKKVMIYPLEISNEELNPSGCTFFTKN